MLFTAIPEYIWATTLILLILSTATILLRFIARYKQKNAFGIDDYLIIPAWLCFAGFSGTAIYSLASGFLGNDVTDEGGLPLGFSTMAWVFFMLLLLGTGFTRLSALFFYRRIFVSKARRDLFEIIVTIAIVIVVLWMITFFILQFFECGTHFQWIFDGDHVSDCGFAMHSGVWSNAFKAFAITSAILDVLVLVLPFPKIWSLHMKRTQKLGLSVIFLLAAIGTIISFLRLGVTVLMLSNGAFDTQGSRYIIITMIAEAGLGLVAINLPSARYLFVGFTNRRFWQKLRSLTHLGSSAGSSKAENSILPTRKATNGEQTSTSPTMYDSSGMDTKLASNILSERELASSDSEIELKSSIPSKPAITSSIVEVEIRPDLSCESAVTTPSAQSPVRQPAKFL